MRLPGSDSSDVRLSQRRTEVNGGERDGLVSTLPHRGTFVEPFDADSIVDDFEIFGPHVVAR